MTKYFFFLIPVSFSLLFYIIFSIFFILYLILVFGNTNYGRLQNGIRWCLSSNCTISSILPDGSISYQMWIKLYSLPPSFFYGPSFNTCGAWEISKSCNEIGYECRNGRVRCVSEDVACEGDIDSGLPSTLNCS